MIVLPVLCQNVPSVLFKLERLTCLQEAHQVKKSTLLLLLFLSSIKSFDDLWVGAERRLE